MGLAVGVEGLRVGEDAQVGGRDGAAERIEDLEPIERREGGGAPGGEDLETEQRAEGRPHDEEELRRREPLREGERKAKLPRIVKAETGVRIGPLELEKRNHLAEVEVRNARSGPQTDRLELRRGESANGLESELRNHDDEEANAAAALAEVSVEVVEPQSLDGAPASQVNLESTRVRSER